MDVIQTNNTDGILMDRHICPRRRAILPNGIGALRTRGEKNNPLDQCERGTRPKLVRESKPREVVLKASGPRLLAKGGL